MNKYLQALLATIITGCHLTSHTADQNEAYNQRQFKELISLIVSYKPLTYIRTGYASVINNQDTKGRTALMWTARCGIPQNIAPLIERGADPFIKDYKGRDVLTRTLKKAYCFPFRIIQDQDPTDVLQVVKNSAASYRASKLV